MGGLRKQFCLINSQQWLNEEMLADSQTSSHHYTSKQDLTEEIMNEGSIDVCNNYNQILANDAEEDIEDNDDEVPLGKFSYRGTFENEIASSYKGGVSSF